MSNSTKEKIPAPDCRSDSCKAKKWNKNCWAKSCPTVQKRQVLFPTVVPTVENSKSEKWTVARIVENSKSEKWTVAQDRDKAVPGCDQQYKKEDLASCRLWEGQNRENSSPNASVYLLMELMRKSWPCSRIRMMRGMFMSVSVKISLNMLFCESIL